MKRCPACHQVYADNNLNFCLADGAALSPADEPAATVSLPRPLNPATLVGSPARTTQPVRRGVNPVVAYAAAGLLVLLIGGAAVLWLKSEPQPSAAETQNVTPSATASPTPQSPDKTPAAKLYRVVGVAEDDVLYIRSKPGPRTSSVGEIPANGVGIQLLDGDQRVGQSMWVRVNYKGITGWVNSRFLTEQ